MDIDAMMKRFRGTSGLIGGSAGATLRRGALVCGGGAMLLSAAGCTASLADGYRPKPLDASSSQRRAYYATPFTPEAENAGPNEQQGQPSSHRPGAY
jgi:hypothetical protein